jgi:FKBP-type peptidyl-prolyl cis-trans isomerase SlyD
LTLTTCHPRRGQLGILPGSAAQPSIAMSRSVVSFHYTLRNQQGQLLDSSIGADPIQYLEGSGQIIDGLEEALTGLAAGTKRVIMVAAERAYGKRDPELVRKVARTRLPVENINVGDMFQTDGGPSAIVTVTAIEGDEVTLDGNHPLADQDLIFDVEVLNAREASPEEIAHGHVHAPGGQSHHDHGHHHDGEGCCGKHDHSHGETPEGCCGGHGHDHGHAHGHDGEGCCGKHDHSDGQKPEGCCGGHH